MSVPVEVKKTTIDEEQWLVLRSCKIEEVEYDTGRITYRVKIWDDDREAFITQTFNDEVVALSFKERTRDQNSSFVKQWQEKENYDAT